MNRKKRNQIESLTTDILRQNNAYSVPVNIEKIVAFYGIDIQPCDFGDDISGVLIDDGQKQTISYNSKNIPTRQKFTIAHEFGHYILEHKRNGLFIDNASQYLTMIYRDEKSSTGEYLQEKEANAFAAAILMPKALVEREIKSIYLEDNFKTEDLNLVGILADRFKVSLQAMSLRLLNLELEIT